MPLSRFIEEVYLGVVHDPHSDTPLVLTEKVTVCPSCHNLHTLRQDGQKVRCASCYWTAPEQQHAPLSAA